MSQRLVALKDVLGALGQTGPLSSDALARRTGRKRRVRTLFSVFGYGTAAQLCRKRLSTLDAVGIKGTLQLLSGVADVRPVGTQGTTI